MISELDRPTTSFAPLAPPLVFVNGQLRLDVRLKRLSIHGPADEREAFVSIDRAMAGLAAGERSRVQQLRGEVVAIVQPLVLEGADPGMLPLFTGRVIGVEQKLDDKTDDFELRAVCDWSQRLTEPIGIQLEAQTLGEALDELNAAASLDLQVDLDGEVLERLAGYTERRGASPGEVIRALCRAHGLFVHRDMQWRTDEVRQRFSVRGLAVSRPVELGLKDVADASTTVAAIAGGREQLLPVKLAAAMDGPVVESTFELLPAWDEADENLPDVEYIKSDSSDFDAVANVFRLWVLGEDGTLSDPPFDLTTFFDQERAVLPQPIVFGSCLSQDSAGRSMGVAVDISTDGGSQWSRYPGSVSVLRDRAGVYLDDNMLSDGWIEAVRADTARLRVTATLRSPVSIETVRWMGNPFAGPFMQRRFDLGRRFQWRRVAAGSKFAPEVDAGIRTADQVDQRHDLERWLVEQQRLVRAGGGQGRINTTQLMLGLRIGDRLRRLAGRAIGVDTADPAVDRPAFGGLWLERIEHDWTRARSQLQWQWGRQE